jgi:hypothetical protein
MHDSTIEVPHLARRGVLCLCHTSPAVHLGELRATLDLSTLEQRYQAAGLWPIPLAVSDEKLARDAAVHEFS